MLVRVTKTVQDRGVLVHLDEVTKVINDPDKDWYCSPFQYGEDAGAYWDENGGSLKGYKGEAWTDTLYWDLDCKGDFEKVRTNALKLLAYLEHRNLGDGLKIYFSGNKGIHVLLKTGNKFTPYETSAICFNVAMKAGVDKDVFDTSVYNVTRIFRIENTRHQASGLFKIELTDKEILNSSEDEIRAMAEKQRKPQAAGTAVDATKLLKLVKKAEIRNNVINMKHRLSDLKVNDVQAPEEFDAMTCPRGKRRCIFVLENGYFGSGERENASIRIAAYYKGKNYDYEQTYSILKNALERRAAIYPDVTAYKEEDIHRVLKEVYSEGWKGGMYSCKSTAENPDAFLQAKCDVGHGPCGDEEKPNRVVNVINVAELIDQYVQYGEEALKDYPKTGIPWLDKKIRIRPKNVSLINGANGSGKTSLMLNIIQNLNKQQIYHVVFSLDMANTSLFEKLGSMYTDYDPEQIEAAFNMHSKNEKVMKKVADAISEKLAYTLFDFTSACDSRYIETTISKLKRDKGVDVKVAFIDYAGRLIGDHDNEFANSSFNALQANDIAKRNDVHLIYLSQVSRENGDHTTPLKTSRVAKHSGAWEECATLILNVWRPFGNGLEGADNYVHVYVAKNRSGALGERAFWWEGKTGHIRELSNDELKEYRQLCEQHEKDQPYEQFAELSEQRRKSHSSFDTDEDDDGEELSNSDKPSRFRKGS